MSYFLKWVRIKMKNMKKIFTYIYCILLVTILLTSVIGENDTIRDVDISIDEDIIDTGDDIIASKDNIVVHADASTDFDIEFYAGLEEFDPLILWKKERPDIFPRGLFKFIPSMPDDFYAQRVMWYNQLRTDLCTYNSSYYLQPEWTPLFETRVSSMIRFPKENGLVDSNTGKIRLGTSGFGSFPIGISTTLIPEENVPIEACFWLRNGWWAAYYIGVELVVEYPTEGNLKQTYNTLQDGTKSATQDPNEVKKYFDVKVESDVEGSNVFTLEPTFPVFYEKWARQIKVSITPKKGFYNKRWYHKIPIIGKLFKIKEIPSGTYMIDIRAIPADETYGYSQRIGRNLLTKYTPLQYSTADPVTRIFVYVP